MNVEMQRHIRLLIRFGVFALAAFISTQTSALILGEAQVQSHLGQPFKARIAVLEISDTEAAQLQARLASRDDYQKLDIPYPAGTRLHFQLMREAGAPPYLRVSSAATIEEPFLNLLLDVSTPDSKLIKSYTLLFDPSGEFPLVTEAAGQTDALPVVTPILKQQSDSKEKNHKPAVRHKRRKPHHSLASVTRPSVADASSVREMGDGSHMKLAMSLSISRFDPSQPMNEKESFDALQEEMIAKEKALKDLKLQIDTMQGMINTLQQRLEPSSAELAPASAVRHEPVVAETAKLAIPVKSVQGGESKRLNYALWLAVLALALVAFVLYRKYKQSHAWQQGTFDDLDNTISAPVLVVPDEQEETEERASKARLAEAALSEIKGGAAPGVLKPTQAAEPVAMEMRSAPIVPPEKINPPLLEQTQEIPAYGAQVVPPEYAMLLKANRYLKSGNDALAEASLLEAIQLNPQNPHGYLALLGLYSKRGDAVLFARLAQQLKATGEATAFSDAAEMGRKLDPENPLYQIVEPNV